MTMVINIF